MRAAQPEASRRHGVGRVTVAAVLASISLTLACAGSAAFPARAHGFAKAIWGPLTYRGVNQFPMYRQLGVSIEQIALNWNDVAPTQPAAPADPADPAYRWPATVQATIRAAAASHMRVLLQLINAPAWADGGHSGDGWAPLRASDFVAFARAAALRYPTVRLWMVWGEPTKYRNFRPMPPGSPGQHISPRQRAAAQLYAQMVDGVYGALKRQSRHNLVIGGCTYTTGSLDTLSWIRSMRLRSGRPPRMDMYAHNPFSYQAPRFSGPPSPFGEVQFSDLHRLAGWIDTNLHRGLPLFLSEFTIPTGPDKEFNFWVDPPLAGQWLTDALRLARRWHRIYALGWVNVYDELPRTAGGLLSANGMRKPTWYAFKRG
ncbi:MAG: hypothetical protein ACJ786_01065 [Catenulispora sp.]